MKFITVAFSTVIGIMLTVIFMAVIEEKHRQKNNEIPDTTCLNGVRYYKVHEYYNDYTLSPIFSTDSKVVICEEDRKNVK